MRVNPLKGLKEARGYYNRGNTILRQAKREKDVVYGGQALIAQLGGLARDSKDYDIKSTNPRKSAYKLQRNLDRGSGGDFYYSTPSKFTKGVHKVFFKGDDGRKGNRDDVGVADFSKLIKKEKFVVRNGVRYATLESRERDARRALSDPQFKFRAGKDREDLARIQAYRSLRKR